MYTLDIRQYTMIIHEEQNYTEDKIMIELTPEEVDILSTFILEEEEHSQREVVNKETKSFLHSFFKEIMVAWRKEVQEQKQGC